MNENEAQYLNFTIICVPSFFLKLTVTGCLETKIPPVVAWSLIIFKSHGCAKDMAHIEVNRVLHINRPK